MVAVTRSGVGPTEPSPTATVPGVGVDDQGEGHDGDDHGVAGPDLQVVLRPPGDGDGDRLDQLARGEGGPLDPGEELGDGQVPGPVGRPQVDGGVEGDEHGQQVAGRGGGAEVAAEGPGVADLGRADGPGRFGQGRSECGEVGHAEVGVGERRRRGGPVAVPVPARQLGHPADGHHGARPAQAVVDLDHEVGARRPAPRRRDRRPGRRRRRPGWWPLGPSWTPRYGAERSRTRPGRFGQAGTRLWAGAGLQFGGPAERLGGPRPPPTPWRRRGPDLGHQPRVEVEARARQAYTADIWRRSSRRSACSGRSRVPAAR